MKWKTAALAALLTIAASTGAMAYDMNTLAEKTLPKSFKYMAIPGEQTMEFNGAEVPYKMGQLQITLKRSQKFYSGYIIRTTLPPEVADAMHPYFRLNPTVTEWRGLAQLNRALMNPSSQLRKGIDKTLLNLAVNALGQVAKEDVKVEISDIEPFRRLDAGEACVLAQPSQKAPDIGLVTGKEQVDALARHQHAAEQIERHGACTHGIRQRVHVSHVGKVIGGDVELHTAILPVAQALPQNAKPTAPTRHAYAASVFHLICSPNISQATTVNTTKVMHSCTIFICVTLITPLPMRLAGTMKQYSRNAKPQLAMIASHSGLPLNLRWPYQARFMKTLEMVRSARNCKAETLGMAAGTGGGGAC